MNIGPYSYDDYLSTVISFHGYAAPGLMMGGFMVDLALSHMPEGVLFDAVCETRSCLPDAIQLLTPCTVGNGWLQIVNLGRYAMSFYDKYQGDGIRVFVDTEKLRAWPAVEAWMLKLKPKKDQDTDLLLAQIREAGRALYDAQPIHIQSQYLKSRHKGRIAICSLCGEPFPADDGAICRGCQGEAPYLTTEGAVSKTLFDGPPLRALPVQEAVDKTLLHDMTMIVPGKSKSAAFLRGQQLTVGDLCRLQHMGKQRVYVEEANTAESEWVHENQAALAFGRAMAGEGVRYTEPPREGKINFVADRSGLFVVDEQRLEEFNMISGVMCASRRSYTPVSEGRNLAGTRAIPLFLARAAFLQALSVFHHGPLLRVLPLRKARVGILVTGSEIFQGLIEDKFIPIIGAKVEAFDCRVVKAIIVPDDRKTISEGVQELIRCGTDLLVTTAGLSVDPDDVTRHGLMDAGATDILYGAPVLPGAMTLLARIGTVQVMGVPACALYFKTTSFDLLFPRLLAGVEITRRDLAKLGHGSFCLECKACTFPKCPFGG
jgi:formylmethanofuran dehydrogenase subunit E